MNPIQKAYESIDRTTIMLKRNQSYCHLRNLYQIRDKKLKLDYLIQKNQNIQNQQNLIFSKQKKLKTIMKY